MTSLGLVVADVGGTDDVIAAAVAGARSQLREGDGWTWVSDRPLPARPPSEFSSRNAPESGPFRLENQQAAPVAWSRAAPDSSRGELYGIGLEWAVEAACDTVAFTDSLTRLEVGWRQALEAALDRGSIAVGGPVGPGPEDRGATSWAGFLTEYGPHAVPPFLSASGDLSANNVAYRLDAVRGDSPGAFWKAVVDRRLVESGHRLDAEPGMVAISMRSFTTADVTRRRVASGRLYGAQVAEGLPWPARLARGLRCAALPAVRVGRLARTVRGDARLRRGLLRALPIVLAAEVAWSIGEAMGSLRPDRRPADVR